jgi:hypothetical protein
MRSAKFALVAGAVMAALALSGPAEARKKKKKDETPPPVQIVVVIPPQPRPPLGAPPTMSVPQRDPVTGFRRTVNSEITPAQTTWNLRSAYNVAALNCQRTEHAQIVVNYRTFLRRLALPLTAANRAVDREFRLKHGVRYIPPREAYMTQVYNYFALPPTQPAFCDAVMAMSVEGNTVPAKDLGAFAARSLPALERVFLDFYNSYDQYRTDLAAWQARYAPPLAAPTTVSAAAAPVPAVSSAR